jgi:predicted small lipoprotein YifL
MIVRLAALVLALAIAACGVKSDLEPPPGAIPQQKGEEDPSKPPSPIGD